MRTCTMCLRTKALVEFSPDRRSKDGCQARCKVCKSGEVRDAYAANPEHKKAVGKSHYHSNRGLDSRMRRKYGITAEEYQRLLAAQGGHCAICPATEPGYGRKYFTVDHDHKTGKVRGLLCVRCNTGLGMMEDSADRMEAAAQYIKSPPASGVLYAA